MDTGRKQTSTKEEDREILLILQRVGRSCRRLRQNLARISSEEWGFQGEKLGLSGMSDSVIVWARYLRIPLPERFTECGAGCLSREELLSCLYDIEQRALTLSEQLSRRLGNTPQTEQFKS